MIFGLFVLVLVVIAQLPSPYSWILAVVWVVVFPRVFRWARSSW